MCSYVHISRLHNVSFLEQGIKRKLIFAVGFNNRREVFSLHGLSSRVNIVDPKLVLVLGVISK